ncbi:hypothetical protein BH20CHL1_BH20CHL1_00910 [soil metagenome]
MATLAVRTLRPRDLAGLRSVRQRSDRLDGPVCRFRSSSDWTHQVMAALPVRIQDERGYVATVDGELCAYLVVERQPRLYQWELVGIAAGSPRLDATDDVCVELWTALINLAIKQAGQSGVKRLFAAAEAGGPVYQSLRANGFEAFENILVMTGSLPSEAVGQTPPGMRRQLNSDIWSVHQLYNHVTPRAVQFAEALTSSEWDLDNRTWWRRLASPHPQSTSFVLDSADGIVGYCRIEKQHGRAMISFMCAQHCSESIAEFLLSAARQAGVRTNDVVQIVVPGYALEHVAHFEPAGFRVSWERTGLVKHTTTPVVVRPQLVPISAVDDRERALRGVPTLYRGR